MSEHAHPDLEKQLAELQDRIRRLLGLVDPEKHPFTYLTLEMNLTREQVEAIFGLMDEARKSLSSGNPMNHVDFERRVYDIVPKHRENYHFAEDIVASLNDSHQYQDVYQHMKKSGMNI